MESVLIMPDAISDLLEFGVGFAFRPENKSNFPCDPVAGLGKVGILTLGYASLTQGYEYLTRSGSVVDRVESVLILHVDKPQRGELH